MANIIPTTSIDIGKELENLSLYKYHPNGIVNVSINRLKDMLDGKVELVDPSNPFVYLLETSSLNTAFAVQEYALQTRKLYPRLANKDEDLYLHMSDYDFLGRFSEPAYADVQFNILFSDFKTKAYYDPIQKEYVLKLPRHLKVLVNKYVFLLPSAIVIRQTENDIVDVKFENQDFNNIFDIGTKYINFNMLTYRQNETYLNFNLKLPEIDIEPFDVPVDTSAVFKDYIEFNKNRKFYYFRAFYYLNNQWNEMLVTHTNEVYDINTPTCIIKVLPTSNRIQYSIPSVYTTTNMIGTKVKFLVYTTLGRISVNFNDYQISDFSTEYGDIFPKEELDSYTRPIQQITKIIYTKDVIDAGKDGLTFEELKDAVIENSIGDRKLPITEKQLSFKSNQHNFNIIKSVDIVSNRLYKLETELPSPLTRYPITKYNLDILEYKTTIAKLRLGNSIISYDTNITVIPEGTVFKLDDGILTHLSTQEYNQLKSLTDIELVNAVNNTNYLTTYYHYILDTSNDRTVLRAYDLTYPSVEHISFKEFNSTTRIGINTINGNMFKNPNGYTLDILSSLKKYTDTIDVTNVKVYLIYEDVAGSVYYLEGTYLTDVNNNPVFRFTLDTDYYIDSNSNVHITNFKDSNGTGITVSFNINSKLKVLYTSNIIPVNFVSSNIDVYVNNSYISGAACGITLEEIDLIFGYYLDRLYTAVHSSTGTYEYETYPDDVPLRYTTNVYDNTNTIIHYVNDIVLDENNEPVIKYPKGSVKLDEFNSPIPINTLDMERYINLLFIDYRVKLVTAQNSIDYDKQIKQHITEVTLENANVIQDDLLDNSEAYVVIPKTIDKVNVKTDISEKIINSMQSYNVDVYVSFSIFNNNDIRDNISYTIIKTIDDYLYENTILKKTEILNILYTKLSEFIVSISINQDLDINTEYLEITDKNSRLSLNKVLVMEIDGYKLKEDIVINFKPIN